MCYVYLAVDERHVPEVQAFLAGLLRSKNEPEERGFERPEAPMAPATPTGSTYVDGQTWGAQMLAKLHRISWDRQHAILTRIAQSGVKDESVSYEQLLEALAEHEGKPRTTDHLRANLAWISRYGSEATGAGKPVAPWTFEEDDDTYHYTMEKSDAQAWLDIVEAKAKK